MRTIAVTSGKGGVGKTNISANLGIALAQRGKKVVIFDADLGLANLDVVLGVSAKFTLPHVLNGSKSLLEALTDGPGGIRFVAGGSGVEALVNLNGVQLERFLSQLAELEADTDFLIFDTGAGIDGTVMTFLQAADETLLVVTPDPASITDAYATAKGLFSYHPNASVRVVMNMVHDEVQARGVFGKLKVVVSQFLNKNLLFGGFIRQDSLALEQIRRRQPFVIAAPESRAAEDVRALVANLLGEEYTRSTRSLTSKLRGLFSFGMKRSA